MNKYEELKRLPRSTRLGTAVLVLTWMVILLSPLMFINSTHPFKLNHILVEFVIPLSLFIVFFLNFLWLAPHVLMKGYTWRYLILNLLIIFGIAILMNNWILYSTHTWFHDMIDGAPWNNPQRGERPLFLLCCDIFNMGVSALVATTIQMSRGWVHALRRKTAIEQERMDMEIKMLRYQSNPHFLLNTLNNIYALTSFNPTKAQTAIKELSSLLRHILYSPEGETVLLKDEVEFINSYTRLMRLRIPVSVEYTEDIDIDGSPQARIVPLLFIPLFENAFKHGVSSTEKNFIAVRICAEEGQITCEIINSNYPKSQPDRNNSGIGLQQVRRRLDLHYKGHYEWTEGVSEDKTKYHSKIILYES